ncbi:MAG: hypothetical protein DI536_28130 [Archangium gephyra]|uniref:Ig-like domain-containing protein n=1 Tax=Archangium gephyra TaxID=48 RepID=A0A2W5VAX8_9BACT|nr:MAG: hypothetical protein DI536_28130 [Archangium gephyra]
MFEIFYECGIVERIVMMNALRPMLVERYPRAHDASRKLRDDLGRRVQEPGQFARFMYLCQALDEAEPVVRWLETYEFKDRMLELVVRDASVYGCAVHAGAEASFARRIDVSKLASETMRADGTVRSREELEAILSVLADDLVTPRRALLAVGRAEDEARLNVLLASITAECAPHLLTTRH